MTPSPRPAANAVDECRVCREETVFFGQARVLGKHPVRYFRCPSCGLIQTEAPFWLDEAYSRAITSSDLGYVSRNQGAFPKTCALLNAFFDPNGRFVDYGGGYGMFVRMMRDAGFNYYRSDLYCENLFANGFDAPSQTREYELLTAFEVFEHLAKPREEFATMLGLAKSVFLSTSLLPEPAPPLDAWWYYGLEHGQHVALYTRKSLECLAAQHGLHVISDGISLHLLTSKRIPESLYRLMLGRGGKILNRLRRRASLLSSDYEQLTNPAGNRIS